MDSILERQRAAHEERERVVAAIVVENMTKKSSQRDQINRFAYYFENFQTVRIHSGMSYTYNL